jgi:superoxide reductase
MSRKQLIKQIKTKPERSFNIMSSQKFFTCNRCGNKAGLMVDKGGRLSCCGEQMAEIIPNTVDASQEKHVPAVTKTATGITVRVGSVAHPMAEDHFIAFVYVSAKNGGYMKKLDIGAEPVAEFSFIDDEPVTVYAFCNLHGLWKCDL